MERGKQLDEAMNAAKKDLIRYWSEVAALNATEAGTLFGYSNYREGRKALMKAIYASDQIRKLTK